MRKATMMNSASFFTKAADAHKEKRPFVIYSKPSVSETIGIFQKDGISHYLNNFDISGYVFAPFSEGNVSVIPLDHADVYSTQHISAVVPRREDIVSVNNAEGWERYHTLVQQAIEAIRHQQFEKVVLSRKETFSLDDNDFIAIYKRLAGLYPDAYSYCWYQPDTGMWVGAFAEQLAKINSTELVTMALAGTKPWDEGRIVWGNKELDEQKYVTSFIVERIADITEEITTGPIATIKAGAVGHLRTDISAVLSQGTDTGSIIQALHPTPAVCGLPQEEARRFIIGHEGYDREYYAGYHGELNCDVLQGKPGQTDLFVNLRCMKLTPQESGGMTADIYVGGGITADSDPESEWLETVNKATTMKRVLFN